MDNFLDVTAHDVAKEEAKVNDFHWNLTDPSMSFFNLIEDPQAIATAAKIRHAPMNNSSPMALTLSKKRGISKKVF